MENHEHLKQVLDQSTKKELEQFAYKPMLLFLDLHGHNFWDKLKVIDFNFKKVPAKPEMIDQLAALYLDEEVMKAYLNEMSARRKEFLKFVLWQNELTYFQVKEQFPKINISFSDDYRASIMVHDPENILHEWKSLFALSDYFRYYYNVEQRLKNIIFKFPRFLKILLSFYFPKPEGYFLNELDEQILQQKQYEIFNFEKTIFAELPIVLSYYKQGKLQFSTKDYPTSASIKKMAKSLHIAEAEVYDRFYLRAGMLAGAFSAYTKHQVFELDSLEVIKRLIIENLSRTLKLSVLFPFLKGINRFNEEDLKADKIGLFLQLFNSVYFEKTWYSTENLLQFFRYRFFDFNEFRNCFYEMTVDTTYFGKIGPYNGSVESQEFASDGFIKSCIYFFASWGILEVIIDSGKYKLHSVFDNIVAFRLTDLGAYLFKKTESYEPPEIGGNKLVFDTEGPFVKVEGNVDLARATLDNVADQITNNRFQFSPGKFLSDVNGANELERKIYLFKELIKERLPPYWENYFKQLVKNSRLIKPKMGLVSFNIPADQKELIRIIATDVVLREIVIKAENFMILVEQKKVKKFKNRMKELGYLIQ